MAYRNLMLKCEDLSYTFSKVSSAVAKDPSYLNVGLNEINDCVQDLIIYYKSHEFSLSDCSVECGLLAGSWDKFVDTLKKCHEVQLLNSSQQMELGNRLETVNIYNSKLMDKLKYLV